MTRKVLIFTGAPESSSLDWNGPDLLAHSQEPFAQHTHGLNSFGLSAASQLPQHAAWRSLSLEKGYLRSGFSQPRDFDHAGPAVDHLNFFAPASFAGGDGESTENDSTRSELASQFYEHSLAIYDGIPSSQLAASSSEAQDTSYGSHDDTSLSETSYLQDVSVRGPLGGYGDSHLSDLEDIPTAPYLLRIHPQTMTVNLIVGVISISPPRSIKTRWGSSSTLVEVLVGDETKSGFAVTFWLPSGDINESVLAGIRPKDIILMQNVGLNVFTKKVYGSSLRKNLTKVHLLYRKRIDATDTAGYYTSSHLASSGPIHPQLDKTKRVREWVLAFVGGVARRSNNGVLERPWDRPPEDTQ